VGWLEPDGRRKAKSCGAGSQGKKLADRVASKTTAELMTGTYQQKTTVVWDDFVDEYTRRVLDGLDPETKRCTLNALTQFKNHIKPIRVFAIDTGHIDDFISKRRQDRGRKYRSTVSAATVNKELRHLRAALAVAAEWGYLAKVPKFRMERTAKKLPRYVIAEHFASIYRACDQAKFPTGLPYPTTDWWRGLLVFGYMTGWRIGDMLALPGTTWTSTREPPSLGRRTTRADATTRSSCIPSWSNISASCHPSSRPSSPGATISARCTSSCTGFRERPASTCNVVTGTSTPTHATSTASTISAEPSRQ